MITIFDEIRSLPSTFTEKTIAQKSNQNTSTDFQPQTQSISITISRNISNTESTESISPTEVTGISIPTSSALIPGITTPLQVPTKTIRSNSDIYNEPNTSEKITSQDNSSDVTSHQLHIQNTANLPFPQLNWAQRKIPMNPLTDCFKQVQNIPLTDYFKQIQRNQTVANQPNK